jgi:tRNA (cmo5U34)-methyltransferase
LTDAPHNTASAFNAAHANAYAEGPPRQVPGFAGLHRMTSMLLAERDPTQGQVLVLGTGGGLELKALADDHADWMLPASIHRPTCCGWQNRS